MADRKEIVETFYGKHRKYDVVKEVESGFFGSITFYMYRVTNRIADRMPPALSLDKGFRRGKTNGAKHALQFAGIESVLTIFSTFVMPIWKKILLECVNALLNNRAAFRIFRMLGLFQAVFVIYPATSQYANYFCFRWRQKAQAWKPWIVGAIRHPSGARTLLFGISSGEDEIKSDANAADLLRLHQATGDIAARVGAISIHFAGIIPGRLKSRRVLRQNMEQEATSIAVVKAVLKLRARLDHAPEAPVVLLGYRGFVGREVMRRLAQMNLAVRGVEKGDRLVVPSVPHLVVNITLPEAINNHIENFNEHSVLLNEVYPAPDQETLERLYSKGVQAYHLAGVRAIAWPAFPGAYRGAVPCCGAIPSEEYEVMLRKL